MAGKIKRMSQIKQLLRLHKQGESKKDTLKGKDKYGNEYEVYVNNDTIYSEKYVPSELKDKLVKEKKRKQFGLIAQEVEQTVPEAVRTMPDGTKAIAYNQLISICIESIKELNLKIDSLEGNDLRMKNLEDEVLMLKKTIRSMQHKLIDCCESGESKFKSANAVDDIKQIEDITETSKLFQNSPNPFSEKTIINYSIKNGANKSEVLLFDMQGKLIKSYQIENTGNGSINIDSNELYPGMFIYSLVVDGKEIDSRRMVLTD